MSPSPTTKATFPFSAAPSIRHVPFITLDLPIWLPHRPDSTLLGCPLSGAHFKFSFSFEAVLAIHTNSKRQDGEHE